MNASTEDSICEAWVRLCACQSLSALRQIQSCIQSCQPSKAPSHDCEELPKLLGCVVVRLFVTRHASLDLLRAGLWTVIIC